MNLNSWDYYELEKEMRDASLGKLIEIYKREDKKYSEKCSVYVHRLHHLNDEGKEEMKKECEFLHGSIIKIALKIAENLAK